MSISIPQTASSIAKSTKQPRGGYLPAARFQKVQLEDGRTLAPEENLAGGTVGSAVEYLSRILDGEDAFEALVVPSNGALVLEDTLRRKSLRYIEDEKAAEAAYQKDMQENFPVDIPERLESIHGADDTSIRHICQMCSYEVCYRQGPALFRPLPDPDDATIQNIRIMAERALAFLQQYGPVTHRHYRFPPNAFNHKVCNAEPDFLTRDTLWDFKCIRTRPTSVNTLQLLIYYIMGLQADPEVFGQLTRLGIFNPRSNTVYTLPIDSIPQDVIETVRRDLLGY